MVKIRLSRGGTKQTPHYRVVAIDSERPRDGKFLELLGTFDSRGKNPVRLKADRIRHWIEKGAQPSRTLGQILKREKVL
jgi:small subunit ribosomal protein S16